MRFVFSLVAMLLSSCTTTTPVVSLGPDTYTISTAVDPLLTSDILKAKSKTIQDASNYCASLEKEIVVTNIETGSVQGVVTADVIFRCLSSGDPDLVRPNLGPAPDVIIESR